MSITIHNETGETSDTKIFDESGTDLIKKTSIESLQIDFGKYGDLVKAIISLGLVKVKMTANLVEWRVNDPGSENGEWVTVSEIVTKDNRRFIYHDDGKVEVLKPIKFVNTL